MDKYTLGEVAYKNGYEKGFQDRVKSLEAEIERLEDILDKKVIEFAYDKKQEIKTEAYKEFAELMLELYEGNIIDEMSCPVRIIRQNIKDIRDNLVEESTKGKEEK